MNRVWIERVSQREPIYFDQLLDEVKDALFVEFNIDQDVIDEQTDLKHPVKKLLNSMHNTLSYYLREEAFVHLGHHFTGFPLQADSLREEALGDIADALIQLSAVADEQLGMKLKIEPDELEDAIKKRVKTVVENMLNVHLKPLDRAQGIGAG